MKGLYYKDLSPHQKIDAYDLMKSECNSVEWVNHVFELAWSDYAENKFKYDGATFVRENNNEFWEVASFVHDWLNITGYVGRDIDVYFIDIMIVLRYPTKLIFERCKWMQWTWVNVVIHKIKRDFISSKLPSHLIR